MGFSVKTIGETSIMQTYLVIRIRAKAGDGEAPMQWAELSVQGGMVGQLYEGDWPVLQRWVEAQPSGKRAAFADNVILLLPGTLVMLYRVPINKGQKKHLAQVVPFLVEEYLAADVEAFHFSHRIANNNQVDIAVIPKELLQQLIDIMADITIEPAFVVAENQLFPVSDQASLALFFEGEYVHVCQPQKSTQTLELNGLLATFDNVINQESSADTEEESENGENTLSHNRLSDEIIMTYEVDDLSGKTSVEHYLQKYHPDLLVKQQCFNQDEPLLLMLARSFIEARKKRSLIDFRTGSFACYKRIKKQWYAWRWVAIAACVWVVLQVVFYISSGVFYKHKAKQFQEQAIAVYKEAFPQDRSVVDVRTSLERKMRSAKKNANSDDTFFKILKRLSAVKIEAGKILSKSMEYNDSGHRLVMDVAATTYEELNSYVNALRKQGVSVNLAGANKEGKQVQAKLVITR